MSFAAPLWLLLALAGAAILYLHVRRRRTLAVPSLMLWQRVASGRVSRRPFKLPPWSLALALQLAVVALLALALAEPLLSGRSGAPRVFVVDATALPEATDALRSALTAAPPGDNSPVSIVAAGPSPRTIVVSGTDRAAVDTAIGWIGPQDGDVDTDRTNELVGKLPGGEAGASWIMGTPGSTLDARIVRKDGKWSVTGTLAAPEGDGPETLKVLFMADGTPGFLDWADETIAYKDDQATFDFTLDVPSGIVSLQAGRTTQRFVLRTEPQPARILYLGEPKPAVVRALQAVPGTSLFQADALPEDDGDFDLVVIDDAVVNRQPRTNTLWLGSAHLAGGSAPAALEAQAPTFWDETHPLSQNVDWPNLRTIIGYTPPQLHGDRSLLSVAGQSLLNARTLSSGRDIHLGVDLGRTPWADDPSYLALMINVLRWSGLGEGAGVVNPCITGLACAIPPRLLGGTISRVPELVLPRGGQATASALPPRAFDADSVLPDGIEPVFTPAVAGLYRIAVDGGPATYIAVNPARAMVPPTTEAGEGVQPAAQTAPNVNIWWLLLAIGLIVIAAEIALAGLRGERLLAARRDPFYVQNRLMLASSALACVLLVGALTGIPLPSLVGGKQVVIAPTAADASRLAPDAAIASMGNGARPGGNVADALAAAAASIPADRNGRVLLAWNGNDTRTGLAQAVTTLVERNIAVDVLPLPAAAGRAVETIAAPGQVFAGDAFTLNAQLINDQPSKASVEIRRDGEVIATQEIDLKSGANRVEALARADEPGFNLFEVAIAGDEASSAGAWVQTRPAPRIAVIAEQEAASRGFADALSIQGIDAVPLAANRAPSGLKAWLGYDAFVLLDLPATALSTFQQDQLEQAVRDNGRGLMLMGGPHSFGPGGYFETPFEALSPLSSRVPRNAPKTGFVFVLDRSGSMERDEGGADRLTIAKAATLNAAGLLNPKSQVGIVAFDSEAHLVLPLQEAGDEAGIRRALDQLDADGGTSVYPALKQALDMLRTVDLPKRHIVVISDGLTQPGDFPALLAEARNANITVSTIAIGDGADPTSLEDIAKRGGGAFHWSRDFRALPGILAQEALLSSSSPVQERRVTPQWVNRADPFLAAAPEAVPAIDGYVDTTAKPRAHLHLATSDADGNVVPIMASWRYGAGQVLALATQATGRWTTSWNEQADYPRFWAQIARGLVSTPADLDIDLRRLGDEARLTLAGVAPSATVTHPDGASQPLSLVERAPGQWVARFPLVSDGDYSVVAKDGETTASARLHVARPAIDSLTGAKPPLAEAVARMTGGKVLADAAEFVQPPASWALTSAWRLWTILAAFFFLASLALRYLPGLIAARKQSRTDKAPPMRQAA